jgi:hypothetical protein
VTPVKLGGYVMCWEVQQYWWDRVACPLRWVWHVDLDFLQQFVVQCCHIDDFSDRCRGSDQDVFVVAAVPDARWGPSGSSGEPPPPKFWSSCMAM